VTPGVALVMIAAVVGALGLQGVRDLLCPWGFRLSVLPVGLMGWAFVVLVTVSTGAVWRWMVVLPSLAVYAVLIHVASTSAAGRRAWPVESRFSFVDLAYLAALWIVSTAAAASGLTFFNNDSWMGYELGGWRIWATSTLPPFYFSWRGLTLPAIHAGHRFLGGEWAFLPYLVLSVIVALAVGYALLRTMRAPRGRDARMVVAVVTVLLMITTAPYVWQSMHVHSHIPTALYLLLAVIGITQAIVQRDAESAGVDGAWMFVAGLSSAGVILTRPDGIAYAFAIHVVCAAALMTGRLAVRSGTVYFASALLPPAATLAVVVATEGAYAVPERLSAVVYGALVVASVLFAVGVVMLAWRLSETSRLRRPGWIYGFLGAGMAFTVVGTYMLRPETARLAASNGWTNLTTVGGWNNYWAWAVVVIAVALATRADRTYGADAKELLILGIVTFFTIAFAVHGLTHPGRLGWGDSLNRVAFHVVPLMFWLFGLTLSRLAERITTRAESSLRRGARGPTA